MSKFTVTEVCGDDDGSIRSECCYGPFASHAEANGAMQTMYDEAKESEEYSDWEGDDTEASHFYLTDGSGNSINWFVNELEQVAV